MRRLAQDVERTLLLRAGYDRAFRRCQFHPERAQDPIPPEERQMCAPDVDTEATQELVFRVPVDVAALYHSVRETLGSKRRAERGRPLHEGEVFDAMLDCALLTWTLRDPRVRPPEPVLERDGYRCAVPGCTSRRNLHRHHICFRSAGGGDLAANLITLCAFHHQRGLHAGLLRVVEFLIHAIHRPTQAGFEGRRGIEDCGEARAEQPVVDAAEQQRGLESRAGDLVATRVRHALDRPCSRRRRRS